MKSGTVQSFSVIHGYGFIKLPENGQVVFAHCTDVQGDPNTLSKGEIVSFDVEEVLQGLKAVRITRKFLSGKITAYYPDRGFGYITRSDLEPDIYFHISGLTSKSYPVLREGLEVEFTEGRNERGPIALNIAIQGEESSRQNGYQDHALQPNELILRENGSNAYPTTSTYIQSIGLRKFKAFSESVTLNLLPITILAGLNSRGKSSIIDALLLLKQTLLADKRVGERITLDMNGAFFKVNHFVEMVYGKNADDGFTISFTTPCRFTSQILTNKQLRSIFPKETEEFLVQVDFTFSQANSFVPGEIFSEIISFKALDKNQTVFYQLTISEQRYAEDYAEIKVRSESPHEQEFDIMGSINFSTFLPYWEAIPPKDKKEFELYSLYRVLFQSAVETIEQELLNHIQYLGPLREEPLREYLVKPIPKDDIGAKGENTVIVLQQNWDKPIRFVQLPAEQHQVVSWQHLSPREMKLGEAINQALWWLGMQELETEVIGSTVQASFSTSSSNNTKVTIADVGFGVSQILPVLTLGLLAKPTSILIFEQPEIHLHPQAQAKLAEIFACFAYLGYRLLIETHSDHLINRMRRLVAEDSSDQLHKSVNIVFVHQVNKHSSPILEELKVNEEGRIINWPSGFLAETADDARAIVQASITKKRQKLSQPNGTGTP